MKRVLIAAIGAVALACASINPSPLATLYVTGNGVQTLKQRANTVITLSCPDTITADPIKLANCQGMASDNATAQASVTEAVKVARASLEAGDTDGFNIATAALTQSLCSIAKLVPGVVVPGLSTDDCQ